MVSTITKYQITEYALNTLLHASNDEEVGYIIDTNQLSIELEEWLFKKMDNCPIDKSYLDLIKEELSKLDLTVVS